MYPTLRQVQALFRRFNGLYFGGALPGWRVRYGDRPGDRPIVEPARYAFLRPRRLVSGYADLPTRTIFLRFGLTDPELTQVLLHEMLHAAGALGHGRAFRAALCRLAARGAPLTAAESSYPDVLKEMEKEDRKERTERRRALRAWRAGRAKAFGVPLTALLA